MATARPLELTQRDGDAALGLGRRSHTVPYLSGPVPDPNRGPSPTFGKLFGKIRGSGATSARPRWSTQRQTARCFTAGHCVADPFIGRFASKLLFVPGYNRGSEPFGRFEGRVVLTTREWARTANSNFDYAALALRKRDDGATVEAVTGAVAMAAKTPREGNYGAYGYPSNLDDGQALWGCGSGYAGDDPRPIRVGPTPIGIGCNMKAGASGGGWLNAGGQLVSLTSFGYRKHPDLVYGPYLTNKATKLVARARRSSPVYPFRDGDSDANGDRGLRERQGRRRRAGDCPDGDEGRRSEHASPSCSTSARARCSRRTRPTSPTSGRPGSRRAARPPRARPERIAAMAEGVRAIIALDDPVGEELERRTLDNGLDLSKVRVPSGVVAVIYEARPNVTVDCAALCLKSGNAIVLRGRATPSAPTPRWPRSCARPWSTPGCPRARSSCWPASAPSSSSWLPPRAWSSSSSRGAGRG